MVLSVQVIEGQDLNVFFVSSAYCELFFTIFITIVSGIKNRLDMLGYACL